MTSEISPIGGGVKWLAVPRAENVVRVIKDPVPYAAKMVSQGIWIWAEF